MTRNRILTGSGEFSYVHVPTKKASLHTQIKDIFGLIKHFCSSSCCIKKHHITIETLGVIEKILQYETTSVVQFYKKTLQEITTYLQFNCEILVFSEMDLKIELASEADGWALNISKVLCN